jgi:hypothetical protein
MIGYTFVIDAVAHGYNLSPENQLGPAAAELAAALYYGVHRGFSPRGQEQWVLDEQRFLYGHNPDQLAHALFWPPAARHSGPGGAQTSLMLTSTFLASVFGQQ